MPVTVHVKHRPGPGPGSTVVRIVGNLEADTLPKARPQIEGVIAAAPRIVVFDLGELVFLSSAGVSLLLDARQRLTAAGSKVFLTNMQPQIARVIEIVNVLPSTSIFRSIAEMDEYLAAIQRRVTEGEEEGA